MNKAMGLGMAAALLAASSAMATVISTDTIYAKSSDSNSDLDRGAQNVVNDSFGAGGSVTTGHTNLPGGTMWLTYGGPGYNLTDPDPYLIIDLASKVHLESMHVWNYNELSGWSVRGVKNLEILSTDDATQGASTVWTSRGTYIFAQAPGVTGYKGEGINFSAPFDARYIKLDINSNWGNVNYFGLSEIQFSTTPVPEPAAMGALALSGLAMLRRRRA